MVDYNNDDNNEDNEDNDDNDKIPVKSIFPE
jgi:hypothetical protein